MSIAPTGKTAIQNGITIYQSHDGKLARAWLQNDHLGVLQQTGAVSL